MLPTFRHRVFYTDKLGFGVDFVYGDPPFYVQVTPDNARLSLRHIDEPVFAGEVMLTNATLDQLPMPSAIGFACPS